VRRSGSTICLSRMPGRGRDARHAEDQSHVPRSGHPDEGHGHLPALGACAVARTTKDGARVRAAALFKHLDVLIELRLSGERLPRSWRRIALLTEDDDPTWRSGGSTMVRPQSSYLMKRFEPTGRRRRFRFSWSEPQFKEGVS
jgi:hypothetical protein